MFFINPFIYAAGADYESIATVTVGSGGASSVEFTSISSDYQHLQIRMIGRSSASVTTESLIINLNSDTGSNYAWHYLLGNGSVASASGLASQSRMVFYRSVGASATASIFGAFVIDILDYASSSKATTVRSIGGADRNGAGEVAIVSALWTSTSAVTGIKLAFGSASSSFVEFSHVALYGIKAP